MTKNHKGAKKAKENGEAKKEVQKKSQKVLNPENYFYLVDGRALKDLVELADCLEDISNDVFCYHVNDSRNDFANWIRDIFENPKLADEIMTIREPRQTQLVILKNIAKNKR